MAVRKNNLEENRLWDLADQDFALWFKLDQQRDAAQKNKLYYSMYEKVWEAIRRQYSLRSHILDKDEVIEERDLRSRIYDILTDLFYSETFPIKKLTLDKEETLSRYVKKTLKIRLRGDPNQLYYDNIEQNRKTKYKIIQNCQNELMRISSDSKAITVEEIYEIVRKKYSIPRREIEDYLAGVSYRHLRFGEMDESKEICDDDYNIADCEKCTGLGKTGEVLETIRREITERYAGKTKDILMAIHAGRIYQYLKNADNPSECVAHLMHIPNHERYEEAKGKDIAEWFSCKPAYISRMNRKYESICKPIMDDLLRDD